MSSRDRCRAASPWDPALGHGWGTSWMHTHIPSVRWASVAPNLGPCHKLWGRNAGVRRGARSPLLCQYSDYDIYLGRDSACIKLGFLTFKSVQRSWAKLCYSLQQRTCLFARLTQYQYFTQQMMRLGNKYWRERESCQDEAFPWDIEGWVYTIQSVSVPLCPDKKNSRRIVTLALANPPPLQTLFPRSLCRGLICVKIGEVCWHLLQEVNIWKQNQADFVPRNQCCWQHACSFMAAAKQTQFLVAVVTIRMQKLFIHHRQELKTSMCSLWQH